MLLPELLNMARAAQVGKEVRLALSLKDATVYTVGFSK
jgi:hypothetical protein